MSKDVFALWFDHGNRPDNASYQYIVVPGISEADFQQSRKNNRNIDILANTKALQAVRWLFPMLSAMKPC